jgi:hypothetical protein
LIWVTAGGGRLQAGGAIEEVAVGNGRASGDGLIHDLFLA